MTLQSSSFHYYARKNGQLRKTLSHWISSLISLHMHNKLKEFSVLIYFCSTVHNSWRMVFGWMQNENLLSSCYSKIIRKKEYGNWFSLLLGNRVHRGGKLSMMIYSNIRMISSIRLLWRQVSAPFYMLIFNHITLTWIFFCQQCRDADYIYLVITADKITFNIRFNVKTHKKKKALL